MSLKRYHKTEKIDEYKMRNKLLLKYELSKSNE